MLAAASTRASGQVSAAAMLLVREASFVQGPSMARFVREANACGRSRLHARGVRVGQASGRRCARPHGLWLDSSGVGFGTARHSGRQGGTARHYMLLQFTLDKQCGTNHTTQLDMGRTTSTPGYYTPTKHYILRLIWPNKNHLIFRLLTYIIFFWLGTEPRMSNKQVLCTNSH